MPGPEFLRFLEELKKTRPSLIPVYVWTFIYIGSCLFAGERNIALPRMKNCGTPDDAMINRILMVCLECGWKRVHVSNSDGRIRLQFEPS